MKARLAQAAGRARRGVCWHWPVIVVALLAVVASFFVQRTLFPLGSGNSDASVYMFQSELLARGEVAVPMATWSPFFRPWLAGEHDGQYFTQYQPGWPAVIAMVSFLTRTPTLAPAVAAGLVVMSAAALAGEVGRRRRRVAVLAAVGAAASPIVLIHGALQLPYLFTSAVVVLALTTSLAAWRTQRPPLQVLTGLLLGAGLLTRPFDVVLVAVPVGIAGLIAARSAPWVLVRHVVNCAVGALPAVLLTLAFNAAVTGSSTSFPLPAAEPLNTFGFGVRRVLPGQPDIDYSVAVALHSLWANLIAAPQWLFGGFGAILLAVGAAVGSGVDRGRRLVVLAVAAAFPFGYLFWWATAWSATGAEHGLGPHYYVPSLVVLMALAAVGVDGLLERWPVVVWALPVLLVPTLLALPPKIAGHREVTDYLQRVEAVIRPSPDRPSVVMTKGDEGTQHLWIPWPFLRNSIDLDDDVLYTADRGGLNVGLPARFPGRNLYRLRREAQRGDDFFRPFVRFEPIRVEAGEALQFDLRFENPTWYIDARPFARLNGVSLPSPAFEPGSTQRFSFPADRSQVQASGELVLGVELFAADGTVAEVFERRFDIGLVAGGPVGSSMVAAVVPGVGWHLVDFGNGPMWLRENIDTVLGEVRVEGSNAPGAQR